jgi:hypothetical protein
MCYDQLFLISIVILSQFSRFFKHTNGKREAPLYSIDTKATLGYTSPLCAKVSARGFLR